MNAQKNPRVTLPTDVEGEVLAYRYHDGAHHVVIRTPGGGMREGKPTAWEFRIPPEDESYFDTVPSAELAKHYYADGTPGATVRLTFDTINGRIMYDRFIEIAAKGNGPEATWQQLKAPKRRASKENA